MTAICAIWDAETGTGAMAADSGWSGLYLTRSNPKIRRFGSALVASAGAMAHIFLDQYRAALGPAPAGAVFDAGALADDWRTWCVSRGHFRLNEEHGCRQGDGPSTRATVDAGLFSIEVPVALRAAIPFAERGGPTLVEQHAVEDAAVLMEHLLGRRIPLDVAAIDEYLADEPTEPPPPTGKP